MTGHIGCDEAVPDTKLCGLRQRPASSQMQRVIGSDPESGSPLKPTAPKQNGSAFRTDPFKFLAEWTGLEPATPGVTGRYSNRLNYHS